MSHMSIIMIMAMKMRFNDMYLDRDHYNNHACAYSMHMRT